jgi:hypothetical protein
MVPEMGFMIKTIFFLFIGNYLLTIGGKKKTSSIVSTFNSYLFAKINISML